MGLPILNTVLLLSSGVLATYAHASIRIRMCFKDMIYRTIMLGGVFIFVQLVEFSTVNFSISERIFGSCFFGLTGFHGFHVVMGLSLLAMIMARMGKTQFYGKNVGVDTVMIYWHFVDVI